MLRPSTTARVLRRLSSAVVIVYSTTPPPVAAHSSTWGSRLLAGPQRIRHCSSSPPPPPPTDPRLPSTFAAAVGKTLRAAAVVSEETASAFFHPQAESPLSALRPPTPPSASDARPFFGQLHRGDRARRYVNVNPPRGNPTAVPGPPLPSERRAGTGAESRAAPVAAPAAAVVAGPPMHMDQLLRRHHAGDRGAGRWGGPAVSRETAGAGDGGRGSCPGAPGGDAVTAVNSAGEADGRGGTDATASTPSQAVRRAESAIAAAAAAASPSRPTATEGSSAGLVSPGGVQQQIYREHCTIGWSPEEFYKVVADVEGYSTFLPWCIDAKVHQTRRVRIPAAEVKRRSPHYYETVVAAARAAGGVGSTEEVMVDATEMLATLWVGFSFFKEQYTSRVTLLPGAHITAALADETATAAASSTEDEGLLASFFRKAADTTGVSAVRRSILKSLLCEWEFIPVPDNANMVEVVFSVSFEFKNPLHARMIMSNVVSLMTRSFERQCERLYGPPSAEKQVLPLPSG